MAINPVPRKSLSEVVAGKLVASMLNDTLKAGSQLPPERELMVQLAVSRSTVREALKMLADNHLIEARQGVGWFICSHQRRQLSPVPASWPRLERETSSPQRRPAAGEIPTGPRRLPVAPEKPLHIPNLRTDRLGTFDFISWWERKRVEEARVMVVGAGALGNEVIQNLALMGVGHLFIVDFDTIEAANLSRSPLFRESDAGRQKAEVAAARVKELNPAVQVQYLHGDVTTQLGLGVIRRMDVIIGCLDNREARLALNRFCYWMNKPWVDGAIQELLGLVRVFIPGQGACFECTLNEAARRDLAVRYSCPLLARQNILLGKVPTTPTIASIIGAMQSQEALKLLHGLPVEPGKVIHFNGMINEMHTTAYRARPDCESHWTYGEVTELPARAEHHHPGRAAAHRLRRSGPRHPDRAGPGADPVAQVPHLPHRRADHETHLRCQLRSGPLPRLRHAARDPDDPRHHRSGAFPRPDPCQRWRPAPAHPARLQHPGIPLLRADR